MQCSTLNLVNSSNRAGVGCWPLVHVAEGITPSGHAKQWSLAGGGTIKKSFVKQITESRTENNKRSQSGINFNSPALARHVR